MDEIAKGVSVTKEILNSYLNGARHWVNNNCDGKEAWVLILTSSSVTFLSLRLWDFVFQDERLTERVKKTFFRHVKSIPYVRRKIAEEMSKTQTMIEAEMAVSNENHQFVKKLPERGLNRDKILKEAEECLSLGKVNWKRGRVSGAVYNYTEELADITSKVYGMCAYTNPLHSDVFPGIRKMEAEVVRMTCNLFHGGENSCGVMTSGGTESIMLACKSYRDRAMDLGIKNPEIVVPITAHAAFDKAASLMNMRIKHVPVDPVTMKVNMKAMKSAISKKTCMLVGSAPQFPHGIMDPVEEIAKLGASKNIPVHVDACLGGFVIPFMEKAGFPIRPFDFRVPGVTSISADTHKYGSAPKGSSVIMYREQSYRHYQYFVQPNWPGGIYASPSMPGSRAGGIIAACWAAMCFIGEDGYVENARKIITTTRMIEQGLREIKGIKILGEPMISVIAIASDEFDIYRLSDALSKKGWNMNILQFPSSIHLCVTLMHTYKNVAEDFVEEVAECTAIIMEDPKAPTVGKAAIYGLAQTIPDRTMVSDIARLFLDACYSTSLPIDKPTE